MKLRIFSSILPNNSQIKALLCDILHLEGRKISKNKYGGHQPKKFENPCLKFKYKKSYFIRKYGKIETLSQSYKNLISLFFIFLLLSLRVCSIRKYCLCYKMAKLNSEKQKQSSFYEEKSLVKLKPAL